MAHIMLGSAELKFHNTEGCKYELGSLAQDGDHLYRYVKANAAIAAGEVVVCDTVATTAIANITGVDNTGDRATGKLPYVEDSGETWTVGQWVGSYLFVHGGTGVGQIKKIISNTATRAYFGAVHKGFGIGLEDDPMGTTPDTTSDITIISPWQVIKAAVSDKIQTVCGYAPFAFTTQYYGWVCTTGVGNPLMGGTGVLDTPVCAGDDTAGQGTICGVGDDLGDAVPFGICLEAGSDNERWAVLLRGTAL